MGKVIALMNEKGGVGKSSLTYSCAWLLAEQGSKVLIVDMDGQMANITYMSGVSVKEDQLTMNDILLHQKEYKDSVVQIRDDFPLYLIPATTAMADAMTSAKLSRMKKIFQDIKQEYDYVFLDVNPSPDWKHALTLSVLDYVGIVMLPDVMSLEANVGIVDSITEIGAAMNADLKVLGIILNEYNNRTNLAKAVQEKAHQMADQLKTKVFTSTVRKGVVMGESVSAREGVTSYAPKSAVADDIRNLVEELKMEVK